MARLLILFLTSLTLSGLAQSNTYFNDKERGWFWKEEPPVAVIEEPEKKERDVSVQISIPAQEIITPRELLKMQGEAWENSLAETIINPTRENYINYLQKTAEIQTQSQQFAEGFKQVVWVEPKYNYTIESPVSTQAIFAKNQMTREEEESQLYKIANEKGMIFFFKSDCPYCHRFAPILKKFSEHYGFSIVAVSLDGKGLPDYPEFKMNHEMARKLNVEVVPAVFLVDPDSNKVSTVGYGYIDWSALTQQVLFSNAQFSNRKQLGVVR